MLRSSGEMNAQLETANRELDTARRELETAEKKLETPRKELKDARRELEAAEKAKREAVELGKQALQMMYSGNPTDREKSTQLMAQARKAQKEADLLTKAAREKVANSEEALNIAMGKEGIDDINVRVKAKEREAREAFKKVEQAQSRLVQVDVKSQTAIKTDKPKPLPDVPTPEIIAKRELERAESKVIEAQKEYAKASSELIRITSELQYSDLDETKRLDLASRQKNARIRLAKVSANLSAYKEELKHIKDKYAGVLPKSVPDLLTEAINSVIISKTSGMSKSKVKKLRENARDNFIKILASKDPDSEESKLAAIRYLRKHYVFTRDMDLGPVVKTAEENLGIQSPKPNKNFFKAVGVDTKRAIGRTRDKISKTTEEISSSIRKRK